MGIISNFTATGLGYVLITIAILLLDYRLYQQVKSEHTKTARYFFYFFFVFTGFTAFRAITGLFLTQNQEILKISLAVSSFLQGFACSFVGYLILYIKFPRINPWIGFALVFLLGILATIFTITVPFDPPEAPYIDEYNAINWGSQPLADYLRYFIYFITLVPLSIIFFQQFIASPDPNTRLKAIGFTFVYFLGILISLFQFFFAKVIKIVAFSGDIAVGVVADVFFLILFLTSSPKKDKQLKKVS